ncbi:MAG: gamma-glutamyltransferase [Aquificae bacterium]|nr:gamma-glutamyltransferase [Aquificota bacterium]
MKGVISAGDRLTALAGAEILKKGGNAFDCAVACILSAPLTEPALTSLGGGGFLLSVEGGENPLIYDFFVDTPEKREENPQFYPIDVDFGSTTQRFHIGAGSVAVPGMVAGIYRVYKEKCTLPLEELIKPAYRYATEGIYLSKLQAEFIKLLQPIFTATPEAREIYAPDGRLIDHTTLFKNTDYGEFLQLFAKEGAWVFYEGEIGDRIEEYSLKNKGLIRKEDLRRYQVVEKEPLKTNFRDYTVYLTPEPSLGGLLIAFTLGLLEKVDLGEVGSLKHLSALIEGMNITTLFRKENVDNGKVKGEDIPYFVKEYAPLMEKRLNLWGNTTHIAVMDSEGNTVSITSTNGEGSGCVIPDTGIMLNNMLGEEDLNPKGFFQWEPHTRLFSMMCPTAVFKGDRLILSLGSAGSNRIRSAILQVILNRLIFNMGLQEAVDFPRVHFENGTVYLEPGFDKRVIQEIEKLFNLVLFKEKSMFFGGVQAVGENFQAGADPRRGGYTLIVD